MSRSSSPARIRPLVGGVVLALAALLATAAPSSAHDRLVSSDPADGAALPTAPASIALTYSEEVLDVGNEVILQDASGATVSTAPAVTDGKVVSLAWPDGVGSGRYTVVWRVVSSDGHPIDGTLAFSVAGAASPAPSDTATSATPSATPSSTAASPASTTDATPAAEEDGGGLSTIAIGGIIAVVAAAGVLGALAWSRRKKP